eukprot:2806094-Amphidinium_carterae.1
MRQCNTQRPFNEASPSLQDDLLRKSPPAMSAFHKPRPPSTQGHNMFHVQKPGFASLVTEDSIMASWWSTKCFEVTHMKV